MTQLDASRLEALCAEVERVWEEEADLSVVGMLSDRNPEYADELRAFAAYLLEATFGADIPADLMERSAARTEELVSSEGRKIVERHASRIPGVAPPIAVGGGTVLEVLRNGTGLRAGAIAQALGVTISFLKGLNACAQVPAQAAQAFAERVTRAFAEFPIRAEDVIHALLHPTRALEFASSKTERSGESPCYADVVTRSGLSEDETTFWLQYDEDHQ